ncbi:MAG: gliding motility protein GldC [Bacteroidia bacterium]|nr:gliding motility protein GldC [Bacteroidia bacterium]
MSKNQSEIKIEVSMDAQKRPSKINWTADSPDGPVSRSSKAMLVSFFDEETKETMKIDLWTNEFQLAEMDRFMFHTLNALTETYFKATGNQELSNHMKSFAQHFGEFTGIIPKGE